MPTRYTSQEYANMHLIYGECRCNASAAARLYRERYPNLERYPDHRVFVNVHRSLTEGGHFPNQIQAGGRPVFPFQEEVLQEVARDRSISVRGIEERTGIPKSTAHRILQRAEMHPFHVQRVQSLLPRDYQERISFCRTMLQRHNENPQFIQKILWSDESTFKKVSYLNPPSSSLSRFDEKESISGVQQLKSSVQKGIRARLLELYPHLENYIDQVLPKKDTFRIVKCHDHIEIMVNSAGELLFFRQREGPWMPTLKLLHKYPFFLPMQQVDKGAIRFVLSGANIMCPGLTSPGARMSGVDKGQVVAVMAEGKEHALAVGCTALSTDDIAKVNKGVGIENCHYLNDGLWQMKPVK